MIALLLISAIIIANLVEGKTETYKTHACLMNYNSEKEHIVFTNYIEKKPEPACIDPKIRHDEYCAYLDVN